MGQLSVRQLLLVCLLLLSACSRDVAVSTVLEDTGGLRPGDKVYLASREVGSVDSIVVAEQTPGFTVGIGLYPEHAELIQANAVAFVPLRSPPMVELLNPMEKAAPVAPGGRLKGLSPMEAAIWQATDTATAAAAFVEQFARAVESYFEGEDWARTRAQIDVEIAGLAADSRATAERIVEELRLLVESLTEEAAIGAHSLKKEARAIEEDIARLEAKGHEELANSLRRLLEQIEAMAPSEGGRIPGQEAREAASGQRET